MMSHLTSLGREDSGTLTSLNNCIATLKQNEDEKMCLVKYLVIPRCRLKR